MTDIDTCPTFGQLRAIAAAIVAESMTLDRSPWWSDSRLARARLVRGWAPVPKSDLIAARMAGWTEFRNGTRATAAGVLAFDDALICPTCGQPAHAAESDDEGRCAACVYESYPAETRALALSAVRADPETAHLTGYDLTLAAVMACQQIEEISAAGAVRP